jgi:hypothetical protein
MELTLNLVWVCVAIAGILVQIVMLSRTSASSQPASHGRKIIAMGCTLVILFFVISMTDDLHDQALLLEERKISRITAGAKSSARLPSDRLTSFDFLLFLPPAAFSAPFPTVRRLVAPSVFVVATAIDLESPSGRAPPISLA